MSRKGQVVQTKHNFTKGRVYLDNDGDTVLCTENGFYWGVILESRYNPSGEEVVIALPAKDIGGKVDMYTTIADVPVIVWEGRLITGCTSHTKRQTLAIFKKLANALGYEVTG